MIKSKIYKLFGVVLVVMLLASLTVGLSVVPAGAASSNLKFTKLELPKVEDWGGGTDWAGFIDGEGGFWCTPGADIGPIAVSPDGDTLFAAVADGFYLGSEWFDVLKSTNGGYTWVATDFGEDFLDTYDPIVDIVVSPDYDEDTTVLVATETYVYQSIDGGKNFNVMDDTPIWTAPINDMDVALDDRGRLAIIVGAQDDVYVFSVETGQAWQEQLIGAPAIAVAFSPTFADDEGIYAVVSDGDTYLKCSFGNTADGGGWGDDIGNAHFTDSEGDTFWSWQARIAFPDDFDVFGTGNNIAFVGITTVFDNYDPDPDDGADVYKVTFRDGSPSKATDLDIRGVLTTLLPTATNVTSLDVSGNAEDCTIIAGADYLNLMSTPELFFIYKSTDGGDTWAPVRKPPTGGAEYTGDLQYGFAAPKVVMDPDFATNNTVYCSTWGYQTDAFQVSTDGGNSWNQRSLIDYADGGYFISPWGFAATGYSVDGTLYMITEADPGNALFKKTGKYWERILSYANQGISDEIVQLWVGSDFIFVVDSVAEKIWRSTDGGATFPKKIVTKPDLNYGTSMWAVSSTTLYTIHTDGNVYWSTKSGVGWTKPDDSEIGGAALASIEVDEDVVLLSTYDGTVFISSDGGETVERVGTEGPLEPSLYGTCATSNDMFMSSGIIYAVTIADNPGQAGEGVWRTDVNWEDPHDSEWVQIDDNQGESPYDSGTVLIGAPAFALPVLYVVDAAPVEEGDKAGGLWRSTNPTADEPYFEKENKGLNGGEALGLVSFDFAGEWPNLIPTFFLQDYATADYWDQIWMYTDTLAQGVTLTTPANNATGAGLLPAGGVYPKVSLIWQEKPGATSYQYKIAIDSDFKSVIESDYTTSLTTGPITLDPNTTYYWKVRVAEEGSVLGAPLISPWSETFKFKTVIGATTARPELEAPWAGEYNVELMPTFEWSGVEWAASYDFELAIDPTTGANGFFTTPLVAKTGASGLSSTSWKADTELQFNTRYYWHVKAIGVDTETPWSDVGTFTTAAEPAPTPTPQPPIVVPPVQQITPAWIYAIIAIGAVLVIAVIVLIVTTRRVP